ncbi:hypothetical protein FRB99_005177 [Tulasnella sp. 403]|nr:hypothetical protein FRB99_005177 [Tulasnella sp. 403]
MTYHDGTPVYKTKGWADFISPPTEADYKHQMAAGKDPEKCREFIKATAGRVPAKVAEYAAKGIYNTDLNDGNVLFKKNYPEDTEIVIVDRAVVKWGVDPNWAYEIQEETYLADVHHEALVADSGAGGGGAAWL